jgi:hypothetical protein
MIMRALKSVFYVSHIEALILGVCGYMVISGVLRGTADYSGLQRWGVDIVFWTFVATITMQIMLSTAINIDELGEEDEEVVDENDEDTKKRTESTKKIRAENAVIQGFMLSISIAYCSLCFIVFVTFVVVFVLSIPSGQPDTISMVVLHGNASWYLHSTNLSDTLCTKVTSPV